MFNLDLFIRVVCQYRRFGVLESKRINLINMFYYMSEREDPPDSSTHLTSGTLGILASGLLE